MRAEPRPPLTLKFASRAQRPAHLHHAVLTSSPSHPAAARQTHHASVHPRAIPGYRPPPHAPRAARRASAPSARLHSLYQPYNQPSTVCTTMKAEIPCALVLRNIFRRVCPSSNTINCHLVAIGRHKGVKHHRTNITISRLQTPLCKHQPIITVGLIKV